VVKLEDLTVIRAPIERCFDLSRSIEVHLAGSDSYGEAVVARGGVIFGLIGMGQHVTWRAKHLGVWQTLTSEITAMEPPTYFQDTMVQGAFQFMQHDHFFRALPCEQTEMKDVFCFAAPLPVLGRLAEVMFLRRYMRTLLHERNVVLKQIAESADWQRYLEI
jgi:ligand-binding SRPBCC domain-containing protein